MQQQIVIEDEQTKEENQYTPLLRSGSMAKMMREQQ